MTEIYCIGSRHLSETFNEIVYKKMNSKAKKLVKGLKGTSSNSGQNESQGFTE